VNDTHDEKRDPHLQQALRHAPDAQVQAPAALGDFILKEARAKARDAQSTAPPAPGWALRLWDWLARPAVATGFAGVMAATLVGVMWWDQPMDEASPRSPVPAVVTAPEPAAPPVAAPPPAPAPVTAAPQVTPKPKAEAPTAPPRARAPARKEAAADAAAPRPDAGATQDVAPAEREDRRATIGSGMPAGAAAPPPPAAPAPAPAAAPPAADAALPEALAKSKQEEQKLQRSVAPGSAESRSALKGAFNESRRQHEAEAFTRVASVRASIAAEPGRWTWQRGGTAAQPMSDAVYAWLAQLDTSAGARWQPRSALETAAPSGRELTLLRDGQVLHRWQLTERGVLWDRGQTAWQVALPAEPLKTLGHALDSAAP
jgi:hypothetical protein